MKPTRPILIATVKFDGDGFEFDTLDPLDPSDDWGWFNDTDVMVYDVYEDLTSASAGRSRNRNDPFLGNTDDDVPSMMALR